VTNMHITSLVLLGLVGFHSPIWAAEPATSPLLAVQESSVSPKETGKGQQKFETHKGETIKQEAPQEMHLSASSPKHSKGSNEVKPEAAPHADQGKSMGESEVPKEGRKKDAADTGTTATSQADSGTEASAKADHPLQKRPLGSNILTVKLAMMGDLVLFPYDIEVAMDGGKAVLSGKVATDVDKRRAEEIARHLDPVDTVVNKLEVVKDLGPALARRHDQVLVQLVKDRFDRSETLKTARFDVKCDQGVIYLHGTVRFQVFALEAAQAARQVPGVLAVDTSNVQLPGEENGEASRSLPTGESEE